MKTKKMSMVDYGDGRYLPDEIVFDEILSRLPARTVVRFKKVCKLWCNSICSQRFMKIHLNRRRCLPPEKLSIELGHSTSTLALPSDEGGNSVLIDRFQDGRHSCDGLIVVEDSKVRTQPLQTFSSREWESKLLSLEFYICNPVIGHVIRFPPPPHSEVGSPERPFLFLDELVNRYKLMFCGSYDSRDALHLFDLVVGSSSWKTFKLPENVRCWEIVRPVALKGCLYWLYPDSSRRREAVASFDITSGDTCIIKPPPYHGDNIPPDGFDFRFVVAIEGSLYAFQSHKGPTEDCYIIWILLQNLEWAIFHTECKTKTGCSFHSGYYNNSTTDSSLSSNPPHVAFVVAQIKLHGITNHIQQCYRFIPHMDTLVSLEDNAKT